MKPIYIILIIAAVLLLIHGYLRGWFTQKPKPAVGVPKEGDKCHVPSTFDAVAQYVGGLPLDGTIKNGVCVKDSIPVPSEIQTRSSNFYQSPSQQFSSQRAGTVVIFPSAQGGGMDSGRMGAAKNG